MARKVVSVGGIERELRDGVVDYVLGIVPGLPVAVVEAKRASKQG
jgi:type I site-specific restriction endonuclease